MNRPWTPAEIDRLRKRRPGDTLKSLAKELGRTPGAVNGIRYRRGLPQVCPHLTEDPEIDRWLLSHYRLGWSDRKMARELGCSWSSPREWRIRNGLPHNGHSADSRLTRADAVRMFHLNRTYEKRSRELARAV